MVHCPLQITSQRLASNSVRHTSWLPYAISSNFLPRTFVGGVFKIYWLQGAKWLRRFDVLHGWSHRGSASGFRFHFRHTKNSGMCAIAFPPSCCCSIFSSETGNGDVVLRKLQYSFIVLMRNSTGGEPRHKTDTSFCLNPFDTSGRTRTVNNVCQKIGRSGPTSGVTVA